MQRDGHNTPAYAGDLSNVVGTARRMTHRGARSGRLWVPAIIAASLLTIFAIGSHRSETAQAKSVTPKALLSAKPVIQPGEGSIAADRSEEQFTLDSVTLAGLPRTYTISREADDLGREDILTFGKPQSDQPFLRLAIRRSDKGGAADASLFIALVRRAAEADLAVTYAGQPFFLPTRLGSFETSEITLSPATAPATAPDSTQVTAGSDRPSVCLGFRLHSTDTRLRILGIACGAGGKAVAPAMVACQVDWLGLSAKAYDAVLKGFFAEADRRRGSACKAPRSIADALKTTADKTSTKKTKVVRSAEKASAEKTTADGRSQNEPAQRGQRHRGKKHTSASLLNQKNTWSGNSRA